MKLIEWKNLDKSFGQPRSYMIEPTGSLDEANRDIVINLLLNLHEEGKTIVIATHDPSLKAIADRVIDIPMLRVD